MKYYVGCGSTKTPAPMLKLITRLSGHLADQGFILRAPFYSQADKAFREGSKGKFYTYLHDEDHKGDSVCGIPPDLTPGGAAVTLARKLNPLFVGMSLEEKRWQITANQLVLGFEDSMARMLVTWTPDGATKPSEFTGLTGNVARFITLADRYGLVVMNLARRDHMSKALSWLKLQ